ELRDGRRWRKWQTIEQHQAWRRIEELQRVRGQDRAVQRDRDPVRATRGCKGDLSWGLVHNQWVLARGDDAPGLEQNVTEQARRDVRHPEQRPDSTAPWCYRIQVYIHVRECRLDGSSGKD